MDIFFNNLKMPTISVASQAELESPISHAEIADAIRTMQNGKAPGEPSRSWIVDLELIPLLHKMFIAQDIDRSFHNFIVKTNQGEIVGRIALFPSSIVILRYWLKHLPASWKKLSQSWSLQIKQVLWWDSTHSLMCVAF